MYLFCYTRLHIVLELLYETRLCVSLNYWIHSIFLIEDMKGDSKYYQTLQRDLGRTTGIVIAQELLFPEHLSGHQFRSVERFHVLLSFTTNDDEQRAHEEPSSHGNYNWRSRGVGVEDSDCNFHFADQSQSEIHILRCYDLHGVRKSWSVICLLFLSTE